MIVLKEEIKLMWKNLNLDVVIDKLVITLTMEIQMDLEEVKENVATRRIMLETIVVKSVLRKEDMSN